MTMLCRECKQQMTRRPDGAWNACCGSSGYWIKSSDVLPRDRWYPAIERNGLTFCPAQKWTQEHMK